ncbi:MAG: hypothetical protein E6Q98_15775 [Rhodospirillaceae bacterium]|nr:MAG: hypothetical protein E6Q98_15775 [Rhodospirillaceae bacterium]
MSGKPKHGLSYDPEYRAWQTMRLRCLNPKNQAYPDYGGRGITVCARWLTSPAAFLADIGPKPSPKHELGRLDVNGPYEPGNCRWVLRKINDRNRRSNHWIEIDGVRRTIAEWCEITGLPHDTVTKRLRAGWPPEKAFSEPLQKRGPWRRRKACVAAIMADAAPKPREKAANAEEKEVA